MALPGAVDVLDFKLSMHANTYIIIPVYNEAQMVGQVIKEVHKYFQNIVCVNDGSKDNSSQVILDAGATLVEHPINVGAGAATQTGIDYALLDPNASYFITIDADGQHEITDAIRMRKHLIDNKLDVVFGSRFIGAAENISPVKRAFLKLAAVFSGVTSGVKLTDPHIGLRVFNRLFAENLKITLPDFTHASEVVSRVKEGDYKYAELPVTVTYSDYSKAKGQPMLNAVNITIDLFFHRISKK
jgi:glycosyltransferase involved in cell wall biosynthesis